MELQNFKTSKPKLPQLESLEELFQEQFQNGQLTNQNEYVQNPHLLIRRQIFQESKTSKFWQKNLPTFYALTNWLSRGNLPFWLSAQQEEAKDQFILFDKFIKQVIKNSKNSISSIFG